MGDRALIVFKDKGEVSPTVYLHWSGSNVPGFIDELAALMETRRGDAAYAAARFVGIAHSYDVGALSLGVMNTPEDLEKAVRAGDSAGIACHSHGDAGLVVVDTADFSWEAYGGYLSDRP